MNLKARFYLVPKTFFTILFGGEFKSAFQFVSDYRILRRSIHNKLANIIEQHKVDDPGIAFQKFLDIDRWVYESMRRVYFLGLNNSKRKMTILDVGTGTGYFPFICNYYGHRAEALDIPDNEMYNEITRELGITRFTQYIKPYKDLHVNNQYDLITAYMICFNNHKTPDVWHIKEWDYFLKSVCRKNLRPGGNLFFSLNEETEEEPVRKELLDYFVSNHAEIKNLDVHFKRNAFLTISSEVHAYRSTYAVNR